jgi:hypothetical protein
LGNLYGWARQPPINQTEEEIAQTATTKIERSERLVRNTDKAAEQKHMSPQNQNGDLARFDEEGDGATSGGHHPKFHRRHRVDQEMAERL